jgi:hypothetical protein
MAMYVDSNLPAEARQHRLDAQIRTEDTEGAKQMVLQ